MPRHTICAVALSCLLPLLQACPSNDEDAAMIEPQPSPSVQQAAPQAASTSAQPESAAAAVPRSQPAGDAADVQPTDRDSEWREDLAYLAAQLPQLHLDLFRNLDEADFVEAVQALNAEIPLLSDAEVIVRLSQLTALPNDSHTVLDVADAGFHAYPFGLYWFEDGLFVLQTLQAYEETLGRRLVEIDGLPVEGVIELVGEVFAHENQAQLVKQMPYYLVQGEILHALGATADPLRAAFTFADTGPGGESLTLEAEAITPSTDGSWVAVETQGPMPLYREQQGNPYFCKHVPQTGMLFLQYNACVERSDLPFADFVDIVRQMVRDYGCDYFVVDLRHNSGGNSAIADPLIDFLAADPRINREGKLFVVIGRATFSSAVLNALALQRETAALLVGEPTGGRPNHFGEVQQFRLPHSRLKVFYSTKYFEASEQDTDSLRPDIPAPGTFSEYLHGVDPAIMAILDYAQP